MNSIDPLIGRILLERYEVLRKLGSGGMGAVYAGRQLAVGREVGLKVLRADLMQNEHVRERFRREAAIIGRLRHPNTIQLIDYGETDDGYAVMVMELLVGSVLSDRLKQQGPLPVKDAIAVCRQVASSLAEAHSLGLVHRDLKPANVFLVDVAGKMHAKVLDFGIARMLDEESTRITSTGQVFGTPRYMSPEQGTASGEVDHRADIYSLGLILFECLVGQPPFVANTSIQYLSAHMTQPPPHLRDHLPDAPRELDDLIDRCLVKDREKRIASADEVEQALRRIEIGLETGTIPPIDSSATMPPTPGRSSSAASRSSVPPATAVPARSAATSPATLRGPDQDPTGHPTRAPLHAPRKTPVALLAAGALASVAALGGIGWYASQRGGAEDVVSMVDVGFASPPDAGHAALIAPIDAGFEAPPDAGEAEDAGFAAEDAGFAADARAGKSEPRADAGSAHPKKADAGVKKGNFVDGITGPRGMWLPTGGADQGPLDVAKQCKTGWTGSGDAKLSLSPCAKGCAVILDGACLGRTPVSEAAVPSGNKNVTVVCGERVVVDHIAKLRSGETTTLGCR